MKKRTSSPASAVKPAARKPRTAARKPADTPPAAASGETVVAGAIVTAVMGGAAPGAGDPPVELQRVRFGYFNPAAREVCLAGSFNDWDRRATPMQRDALGDWTVELELPPGEYRYRLVVDGEWRDDPSAPQTAQNPFGGYDAVLVVNG
jgi:hypothetical protein